MIEMKKVLSLLFSFLFAICSLTIVSFSSDNQNLTKLLEDQNTNWQTKGEKCVNLSDGITYNIKFFISEDLPCDCTHNNTCDINYKCKKVLLSGEFYDEEKNKLKLDNYLGRYRVDVVALRAGRGHDRRIGDGRAVVTHDGAGQAG